MVVVAGVEAFVAGLVGDLVVVVTTVEVGAVGVGVGPTRRMWTPTCTSALGNEDKWTDACVVWSPNSTEFSFLCGEGSYIW